MSFFSLLLALLIEQARPLARGNAVHAGMRSWLRWVVRKLDAGETSHGWLAWSVAVLLPALIALGIYWLLCTYVGWPLAMLWNVAVLYVTLGFRQFSHHFTAIRDALEAGQENRARELLAHWQNLDASELPRTEILRHVLEYSLLAAHRHVFGVFFWFVALSTLGLGPAGAVLYRLAEFAGRYWAYRSRVTGTPTHDRLMDLSQTLFGWLDHVPARMTAFGFAVVGNFEDAVDAWRRHAVLWLRPNEGTILSAASGALGVRLGGQAAPVAADGARDVSRTLNQGDSPSLIEAEGSTQGTPPSMAHLRSVVGLIWRSVVLWMLLLALLSLANLIG